MTQMITVREGRAYVFGSQGTTTKLGSSPAIVIIDQLRCEQINADLITWPIQSWPPE